MNELEQEKQKQQEQEETEKTPSVFDTSTLLPPFANPPFVENNIPEEEEPQSQEEPSSEGHLADFYFAGRIIIGILDSVAILIGWLYARRYGDIEYAEIQKILGLRGEEKTELSRALGRILYKRKWLITEEVLFVISLVRIYSMNKIPALQLLISSRVKNEQTETEQKKKTRKAKQKTTKKQKIKVSDVLEEIRVEE